MTINGALIQEITLNQSASSVTFSSIPQTGYTDLRIIISARGDAAYVNGGCFMQINSITTGYSAKDLYGDGSSASSSSNPYGITSKAFIGAITNSGATTNTFGSKEVYIPNYTSSNQKSISSDSVIENNGTTAYSELMASLCTTTDAITSLTFTIDSGNFVAGSTFSLYGIAALGTTPSNTPKATGGDIVVNDGTYWYHAFLSTSAFIPQTALTADVLVIAGGGPGGVSGDRGAGGGGAGGLAYFASQSLTATSYTCSVGAGGSAAIGGGSYIQGSVGSNSIFGSLTAAIGGGAGGTENSSLTNGLSGGSGGGGGGGSSWAGTGGSPTSGQGNSGGNGASGTSNAAGGGGGGAGAAGANASSGTATAGGVGSSTYSSWGLATNTGQNVSGTVYYAGGGGGASGINTTARAGGYGGGGASTTTSGAVGVSGSANTGGGGGAQSYNGNSGAGGSGIIIIKYAMA